MKPIIMTLAVEPTGADLFDKYKRDCRVAIKPEKDNCGCSGNPKNETMELTGNVIDKVTKEPLIGAHILNMETGKGTQSDASGDFNLEALGDQIVTISFVGMKSITLPASQITTTVEMEEDIDLLDEVIITAKKSVKKYTGVWVAVGLVSLFAYAKTSKPKRATVQKPTVNG